MITLKDITGLVLAGGRGSRMGGVDKGLQLFQGMPLAQHALLRLQPQVGRVFINANRNQAIYESFGAEVRPDALPDYAGPLAGFLTGMRHCTTPYLVTAPCDTPRLPLDLVTRLAAKLAQEQAEIAMATAPEPDDQGRLQLRPQPVFCLLSATLIESLTHYTQNGGRKIDAWTAQHRTVFIPFNEPGDDLRAFSNVNTLAELEQLEQTATRKEPDEKH